MFHISESATHFLVEGADINRINIVLLNAPSCPQICVVLCIMAHGSHGIALSMIDDFFQFSEKKGNIFFSNEACVMHVEKEDGTQRMG